MHSSVNECVSGVQSFDFFTPFRLNQPSKFLCVKQEEEELEVTAITPGTAGDVPAPSGTILF